MSAVNLQLYTEVEGQLKSKTKFLAIIAHDLSGPVGTIMGFLNILNSESDLKEEQRKQFLQKTGASKSINISPFAKFT